MGCIYQVSDLDVRPVHVLDDEQRQHSRDLRLMGCRASLQPDILVLLAPRTDKTRHILGKGEFDILAKRKPCIVNASRGDTIFTDELVAALRDGRLRGAALDVTDPQATACGPRTLEDAERQHLAPRRLASGQLHGPGVGTACQEYRSPQEG